MKNLLLLNFMMMRNRLIRLTLSDEIKIAFFLFLNFVFLVGFIHRQLPAVVLPRQRADDRPSGSK